MNYDPTALREAALNFQQYADTGNDTFVGATDCEIAAAALRELADLRESAGKDFLDFYNKHDEFKSLNFLDESVVLASVEWAQTCFLAGHAQGTADAEAKVAALCGEVRRLDKLLNPVIAHMHRPPEVAAILAEHKGSSSPTA